MQEQQQGQSLNVWQRIHAAIQLNKMLNRARGTRSTAFQTEDAMVKIFEHLNVSAPAIETFKERLEKRRQAISLTYIGDTYIMGGILFYCGILLPVLVSLGTSDSSTRLAWIAFAVSLPCTVGFFLVRFLKKKNNISNYGVIHGGLAALAQIGIVARQQVSSSMSGMLLDGYFFSQHS